MKTRAAQAVSNKAFSLAAVLGLILVFSIVVAVGVRYAGDYQRITQSSSEEKLSEQKVLAYLSSLKSVLASDLSKWVFDPYKTNFITGSSGGTMVPVIENLSDFLFNFDPGDPNITYEVVCLSEGAGGTYWTGCQEQKGIGIGRIPRPPPDPPGSTHAFLPKLFKVRLVYRNPQLKLAYEITETWEFTSLRLNNFSLILTGQEGSQVMGPMTYGARVNINLLTPSGGPEPTLTLNNAQGPIIFKGLVTTNLPDLPPPDSRWIPSDPLSSNPISYEQGIAYDQAAPISTEHLIQSFQIAAQSAQGFRRELLSGSRLQFLSNCRIQITPPGGTPLPPVDLEDNQFYVSPGTLTILHSTEPSCKRVTLMATQKVELKGSIRAKDDQTALAIVSLNGNIEITSDATSLAGSPLMTFTTSLGAQDPALPTSFQIDAALVAPNGQAPSLHESYLSNPDSVGLGRLIHNGMAVAKELTYFQEIVGTDVNGFTTLTRNFNPRFLVRSQAPPGLDIETRELQVQVIQSNVNHWSVDEVRRLLGVSE